jgi:hypothetical protein
MSRSQLQGDSPRLDRREDEPAMPGTSLNFERIFIMKSNFIAAAVVAVAALTSVAASAQTFNSYLFDQMQAPATKTRAEVKSDLLQAQNAGSASSYNGATAQQNLAAPRAEKAGAAPQAAAEAVKTSQQ